MAISKAHFDMLLYCKEAGIFQEGGSILEIGEANWYGDFHPHQIFELAGETCDPSDHFAVAKLIYKAIFRPSCMVAIDAGGPTALKDDLNHPILRILAPRGVFEDKHDVVYNHGTAEHIFNIGQVFRTMHDCCKPGGLMIHECPFTGWVDHGFYCLQPTLFWDLSTANGYKIEFVALEDLSKQEWVGVQNREAILQLKARNRLRDNLMLFVIMRKATDEEFRIPMQGVYAGTVSQEATAAWKTLR